MTMNEDPGPANVAAADLFQGMGDPSRVAILRHLLLGEHNVSDLTAHVGLAQPTVSHHLALLRERGLVTSRPHGRSSVYSLSCPEEIRRVLHVADELAVRTAARAAAPAGAK